MKIFLLILLNFYALYAFVKDDFAYGKNIEINKNFGLVSLELSPEIYTKLKHTDLSDLAVFDFSNNLMPQDISSVHKAQEQEKFTAVPFIKFSVLKEDKEQQLRFEYKGADLDVQAKKQDYTKDYILDLRAFDKEVHTLHIESELRQYMLHMDVDCSNDLQAWKALKSKAVIAHLNFQDSLVENNTIKLPFSQCNYLRLRAEKDFLLSKAMVKPYAKEKSPVLQKKEILFKKTEDRLEFDLSKNIKINKLHFTLAPKQQYYKLSVYAKNKEDKKYRLIKNTDIYTISLEGKVLKKHFITLNSKYDIYKIEAQKSSYLPLDLALSYTYKKKNIYFLAQGKEPYTLVFGSLDSRIEAINLAYLISNTDNVTKGKLGQTFSLGGEKRLNPKKEERPLSRYMVWVFLVLGVLLLGYISYRLYTQRSEI